ncbi:MAG: RNA methyltransferase [Muribaculaceae bacterium]|nr:RNA methyltransferase [Muribaculaceae bacterium]
MKLSKTKESIYASLSTAKMRRKHGLFIVEGAKSVYDTIDTFEAEALIVGKNTQINDISFTDKIFEADDSQLQHISRQQSLPDMIAIYKLPQREEQIPELKTGHLYVVLDGIQDPGNMGTIIRTSHWFGVNTIFASIDTVDLYNPKVIQSTMGSLGRVRVIYCDIKALLERNNHIPVYGTLLDGKNIYQAKLMDTGFIIFGNEGNGISEPIRKLVNKPLLIPPYNHNHSESLNVGVAAGITLAMFRKE